MATQQSLRHRIIKGVGLSLVMILMVGTCYGYPGLQPGLEKYDIYGKSCNTSTNLTLCVEKTLALSASVSFGLLYCSCFFVGVYVDVVGVRLSSFIGIILWTIFTVLSGLFYETNEGWVFFIGFVGGGITSLPIFFGMGELTEGVSPDNFKALMTGLLTGFWDLGTIVYLFIEWILEAFKFRVPIWIIFSIYALGTGIPTLFFFIYYYPPWKKNTPETLPLTEANKIQEEGEDNKDEIDELELPSDAPFLYRIKNQIIGLWRIIKTRLYIMLVCQNIIWVIYASFLFPLIKNYMMYHGASSDEALNYLTIWSIMLPTVGFVASLFVGFRIDWKNTYSLISLEVLNIVMCFILSITSTLLHTPLWVQGISFFCIVIWRMNSAAIFNSFMPVVFVKYKKSVSSAIGLNWTVCGIFSLVIVPFMTEAALTKPNSFFPINLVMSISAIVISVICGVLIYVDIEDGKYKEQDKKSYTKV